MAHYNISFTCSFKILLVLLQESRERKAPDWSLVVVLQNKVRSEEKLIGLLRHLGCVNKLKL